jgi:hypothetical protein
MVRLALKVVAQNDRSFVDVILLYTPPRALTFPHVHFIIYKSARSRQTNITEQSARLCLYQLYLKPFHQQTFRDLRPRFQQKIM